MCTMQEDDRCVGFAFATLYHPLRWWFGSYFGVTKSYREKNRAATFLKFITEKCESIEENSKGAIFEIERYQETHIQTILAKCEASKLDRSKQIVLTKDEEHSLQALRRVALYTVRGVGGVALPLALAFVTKHKRPRYRFVEYIQPAMQLPLTRHNEVNLWLMMYPFGSMLRKLAPTSAVDIEYELTPAEREEIFDFLYMRVFPAAYARDYHDGGALVTGFDNFFDYVRKLRRRVEARIEGRPVFLASHALQPSAEPILGRCACQLRSFE